MDAGCGTAILSIMASKLGAKEVEAFDIDEWSVVNGEENAANNQFAKAFTFSKVKLKKCSLQESLISFWLTSTRIF
jgi:ribosomal protein L11 methylase PrmA